MIGAETGFIDRRTGYGEIWHFLSDSQVRYGPGVKDNEKIIGAGDNPFGSPIWKQYLFKCKPSPRAMF